jgi:hypothetical protein
MGPFYKSPVAIGIPFDNSTNGFIASEVQSAIEEAVSKPRWLASAGFDGNASVGRYLEYTSNVDSNIAGLIIPKVSKLQDLSLAVTANSTCTFSILTWNGVVETSIASISLVAARKSVVSNLNVTLNVSDEIRIKLTSGTCSRPVLFQFFQVV